MERVENLLPGGGSALYLAEVVNHLLENFVFVFRFQPDLYQFGRKNLI
jgi:hypothetical protein